MYRRGQARSRRREVPRASLADCGRLPVDPVVKCLGGIEKREAVGQNLFRPAVEVEQIVIQRGCNLADARGEEMRSATRRQFRGGNLQRRAGKPGKDVKDPTRGC